MLTCRRRPGEGFLSRSGVLLGLLDAGARRDARLVLSLAPASAANLARSLLLVVAGAEFLRLVPNRVVWNFLITSCFATVGDALEGCGRAGGECRMPNSYRGSSACGSARAAWR